MLDSVDDPKIVILGDSPSSTDQFEGGPHKNVAETLFTIMKDQKGGRAIGMEGTWGSGKSTVIDILEGRLASASTDELENGKFSFFIFDAWAHQSDPLRRVFLQEMIRCLSEEDGPLDHEPWSRRLTKLETRHREITEKKAEVLTFAAKAVLAAVPLYPIAYWMLRMQNPPELISCLPGLGSICHFMTLNAVGFGIFLVPFIALGLQSLMWRSGWQEEGFKFLGKGCWKKGAWKRHIDFATDSLFWAFTRTTDEVKTQQWIKESEATTVEFNEIFDAILGEVKAKKHKVVIVFDNIDRLPHEQIRTVWGTMRTFFAASPGSKRHQTLESMWLIVPFDRRHIRNAFEDQNQVQNQGQLENESNVYQFSGPKLVGNTASFIEKTFEILVRVSPPTLSDWRKYMSDQLDAALGGILNSDDTHGIFRIFDIFHGASSEEITPRSIKAFVNTLSISYIRWRKTIPFEHQSLYILYKEEIFESVRSLQDSSIVSSELIKQLKNPDWARSLAAIHYNVEPDLAFELLLHPVIKQTISSGNNKRLEELSHTRGFETALESYLDLYAGIWNSEAIEILLKNAATIHKIELSDSPVERGIWRRIIDELESATGPIDFSKDVAEGFGAVICRSDKVKQLDTAKQLVKIQSQEFGEFTNAVVEGEEWYQSLETIWRLLADEHSQSEIKGVFSKIPIPDDVAFLFAVARVEANSGIVPLSCLRPCSSESEIHAALAGLMTGDGVKADVVPVTRSLVGGIAGMNWLPTIETVQHLFQNTYPPKDIVEYRYLVEVRALIADRKGVTEEILSQVRDDGSLYGILTIAVNEDEQEVLNLIAKEIVLKKPGDFQGLANHAHFGDLAVANDFLTDLAENPENQLEVVHSIGLEINEDRSLSWVIEQSLKDGQEYEIYRALFRYCLKDSDLEELGPDIVLTRTGAVSGILGEELMNELLTRTDDLNWDIESILDEMKWGNVSVNFLIQAKPLNTGLYKSISGHIHSQVNSMTKEEWLTILDGEQNGLHLVIQLMELGESLPLGIGAYDALLEHAEGLISGGNFPKKFLSSWYRLVDALPSKQLSDLSISVREKIVSKSPARQLISDLIVLLGRPFVENAQFEEDADDVIRVILGPIIADGTKDAIELVQEYVVQFGAVVKLSSEESRETVRQRLAALVENGEEEVVVVVRALATSFDLEIVENVEPEDADNESESGDRDA